ncbi:MAG: hypothetical protein GXP08_09440 [Gammaproteobacteria bacterium]|nr:hypothetical protein [Gammaproteobacteria bacterium]
MIVVSDKLTTESFHAFIDEQLSDEQCVKVEALLDEIPEKIEEIQQYQLVNERLREVFDVVVQEAIPDDLYQLAVHGLLPGASQKLASGSEDEDDVSNDAEQRLVRSAISGYSGKIDHSVSCHDDEFADLAKLSSSNHLDSFDIDSVNAIESPAPVTTTAVDTQTVQLRAALDLGSVDVDDDETDETKATTSDHTLPPEKERVTDAASTKQCSKPFTKHLNSSDATPADACSAEAMSLKPLESASVAIQESNAISSTAVRDGAKEALLHELPPQPEIFRTLEPNETLVLESLAAGRKAELATSQGSRGAFIHESDTSVLTFETRTAPQQTSRQDRECRNLTPQSQGVAERPESAIKADPEWQKVLDEIHAHATNADAALDNTAVVLSELDQARPGREDKAGQVLEKQAPGTALPGEKPKGTVDTDTAAAQFDNGIVDHENTVSDGALFSSASSRLSRKIKNGIQSLGFARLRRNSDDGDINGPEAEVSVPEASAQAAPERSRKPLTPPEKLTDSTPKQRQRHSSQKLKMKPDGAIVASPPLQTERKRQQPLDKAQGVTEEAASSLKPKQALPDETAPAKSVSWPGFKQTAGQTSQQTPAAEKNIFGAGAISLVLIGIVIGVAMFALMSNPVTTPISSGGIQQLAINSHILYTQQDQNFIGESKTSIIESLQWLSARTGKPVRLADITVKGHRHKHSIIIPSTVNYATVNIYENIKKQKMTVVVAANVDGTIDSPLKCRIPSNIDGLCSWVKDSLDYVVVANLSLTRVREFSQSVLEKL